MIFVCTTNVVSLSIAYLLSYDKIKISLGMPVLRASAAEIKKGQMLGKQMPIKTFKKNPMSKPPKLN